MTQIPLRIDEPKGRPPGLSIVLAHGAGAGMDSAFMQQMAESLAASGLRVVRFDFPYMQTSRKTRKWSRPDPAGVLEETWFQVIEQAGPAPAGDRRQVHGRPDCKHGGGPGRGDGPGMPWLSLPPCRQARFTAGGAPREAEDQDPDPPGDAGHPWKQGGHCRVLPFARHQAPLPGRRRPFVQAAKELGPNVRAELLAGGRGNRGVLPRPARWVSTQASRTERTAARRLPSSKGFLSSCAPLARDPRLSSACWV